MCVQVWHVFLYNRGRGFLLHLDMGSGLCDRTKLADH